MSRRGVAELIQERAHIKLFTLLPKPQFKITNCIQMDVGAFVVSLKHYNMIFIWISRKKITTQVFFLSTFSLVVIWNFHEAYTHVTTEVCTWVMSRTMYVTTTELRKNLKAMWPQNPLVLQTPVTKLHILGQTGLEYKHKTTVSVDSEQAWLHAKCYFDSLF